MSMQQLQVTTSRWPSSHTSIPTTVRRPSHCPKRRLPLRSLEVSPNTSVEAGSTRGSTTVKMTLKMPVGIVFAQSDAKGPVVVDEITPGGPADKTGKVCKGDVLASCSAVVLKEGKQVTKEGYGDRPYDNWERVMFNCREQEFKTVMSALKSNTPRWGYTDVVLEFEKP